MSYNPAYYAPHVNALNYANTVTATFESNFPGMFGFAESEEKAHALLACALAHQSRSTLNRLATAMNYVGGSALSLLSSVVGSPALNVPGLSAQVAQQIADEFVAVALPIAESLNAKLENVAQPGTFFSAPTPGRATGKSPRCPALSTSSTFRFRPSRTSRRRLSQPIPAATLSMSRWPTSCFVGWIRSRSRST